MGSSTDWGSRVAHENSVGSFILWNAGKDPEFGAPKRLGRRGPLCLGSARAAAAPAKRGLPGPPLGTRREASSVSLGCIDVDVYMSTWV